MTLTGKALIEFEKWYIPYIRKQRPDYDKFHDLQVLRKFHRMIEPMRYGVLVDFSETLEEITNHKMTEAEQSYIAGGHSRGAARTFTVLKFNDRYNKNNK